MLSRLDVESFDRLQRPGMSEFPLIAAVLEQTQEGEVFADSGAQPRTIFVIGRSGFSYLHTEEALPDYARFIRFLVDTPSVPQYIHIYDAPQGLIDYVASQPDKLGYKLRKRVQLQYRKPEIAPQDFYPATGMEAIEIDSDNIIELAPLGLDIENKFWSNKAHFFSGGYGVFLQEPGDGPATVCYAAAIGNGLAEVDILTAPAHQKKGLAKYAAALFIRQGLARGIRTNWDCFEDNVASYQTAIALGFEPTRAYMLASIFSKEKELK